MIRWLSAMFVLLVGSGCKAQLVAVSGGLGGAVASPGSAPARPAADVAIHSELRFQFRHWSVGTDAESWPRSPCCTGYVVAGPSAVPHPWAPWLGYEILARVGFGASTLDGGGHLAAGVGGGLPMRITAAGPQGDITADAIWALALVPYGSVTRFTGSGEARTEWSVGLGLRLLVTLQGLY